MPRCSVCDRKTRTAYEWGLCLHCWAKAWEAIELWKARLHYDLQVMVEFDAYCAAKEAHHANARRDE